MKLVFSHAKPKNQNATLQVCIAMLLSLMSLTSTARNEVDDMDRSQLQQYAADRFRALPESVPGSESDSEALIALGKMLYADKNLSKNRNISCDSCHPVVNGGVGADNLPQSVGTSGQFGTRNSPTVLNTGFHRVLFWDARAASLTEQARGPLLSAIEMGMETEEAVVARVIESSEYTKLFAETFPESTDSIDFAMITESLAAFQRSLVVASRFDDFAAGDVDALSDDELSGFRKFVQYECKECHSGFMFGGSNTDKLGIKHPYPDQSDLGVYLIDEHPNNKMKFKVCSLRNVGLTAPYFHNGKVKTLEEAVRLMAWHQKGHELSEEDINDISAFLRSLSGKQFVASD